RTLDRGDSTERRARALLAAGRPDDAAIVFDSILFKNPFYHLDPARSDPEVVAILRRSKRVLLPTLAQRHYDQAMSAYDGGDAYRAISEGERASALLADSELDDPPADLKAAIANVLALARTARTTLEERVYTAADRDVTPPRALGRQLPAAPSPAT